MWCAAKSILSFNYAKHFHWELLKDPEDAAESYRDDRGRRSDLGIVVKWCTSRFRCWGWKIRQGNKIQSKGCICNSNTRINKIGQRMGLVPKTFIWGSLAVRAKLSFPSAFLFIPWFFYGREKKTSKCNSINIGRGQKNWFGWHCNISWERG